MWVRVRVNACNVVAKIEEKPRTTRCDFDIVSKFAGNREPCTNLFEAAAANRISLWQYISFKILVSNLALYRCAQPTTSDQLAYL